MNGKRGAGGGYTLYAGTDSGMAMSTDRGDTWRMAPDENGGLLFQQSVNCS